MQEALKMNHTGKLTWGELKKFIEESGVRDKDELDRIDISWGTLNDLAISYDEDFGWQLYL